MDAASPKLAAGGSGGAPAPAGAGIDRDTEYGGTAPAHDDDMEREDDEAHLAAASTGQAAGVGSYLRGALWSAFMFCMEIPPHLEKNIQRKVKKLSSRSRVPTRDDLASLAKTYIYTPRIPILAWGKPYFQERRDLVADLIAGFTISVMLIPQSMAYALLAGLPPVYGMYTALWAPAIYGLFGTSKHLQIGPTSLISLYLPIAMAMAGVTPEHFPNDPELDAYWRAKRISLAPVLTFWVGIIFLVLSITKAGNLIKFVSHSVMTGFVSAAGLFIGLSQLPQILGYNIHGEFPKNYMLFEYFATHSLSEGNRITQRMGGLAFLCLYGEKVFKRVFPPTAARMKNPFYKAFKYVSTFTTVYVVIATAIITKHLASKGIHIRIVGDLDAGYAPAGAPDFKQWPASVAFPAALPLALLGYMEAYSVARKYSLQFKYPIVADQELFAFGVGNLFGCLFSSYPTSGNFGRTALAASIGQRTPAANIVVSILISIALGSLLPALHYVPFCTLAAIICAAVITLVDWPEILKAVFLSKLDALVMALTFFVTLFVSISDGLGVGILASVICLFYKLSDVETVTLGREPQQNGQFVALTIYPQAEEDARIKVVRISGRMAFMNAASLRDKLFKLVDTPEAPYRDLIFDCAGVSSIDLTAILALTDILLEAEKRDIRLHVANVPKEAQSNLRMSGLLEHLGGEDGCRRTVEEVYARAKQQRADLDANPAPRRQQVDDGHH